MLQNGGEKMNKEKNKNWTLKIFALIIAIILWSYVMSEVDPPFETEYRNIDVVFVNEAGLERQGLVILEPKEATVRVTVGGRRSDVIKAEKDIVAKVDLSGYSEGTVKVPVSIEVPNNVRLIDYYPKEILFKFDRLVRQESPVVVETTGKLPEGYVLGKPEVKPQYVYIEGPKSWVDSVERVVALVNIDNRKEDINVTVPIRLVDSENRDVRGVGKEQNVVEIFIPVYQVKKVPIELETTNQLPDNYEIVNIGIRPNTIEIQGKRDVLSKIDSIKTKPLDINLFLENNEMPVELEIPTGVKLSNPDQKVIVTIDIEESLTKTFNYTLRDVNITNIKPNLYISEEDLNKLITISLRGSISKIDSLNKEDIILELDLKDLEAGSHTVDILVKLEDGVEIVNILPESLQITLIEE